MLSLVLRPFSQKKFRQFNSWAAETWWGLCVSLSKSFYGIQVAFTGDNVPTDENAIIILNHQSMTDIPVVLAFAQTKKRLGDLKWFVKDIIKYIPGIGWGMLFLDCLFIKRNWTSDKDHVLKVFEKIMRYAVPVWIVSFVEGTRVRPAKLIASQEYARRNNLKVLQHVLLPRTKGLVSSVQSLRNHVHAVYDLTIGYVGGVPKMWQWIRGDVRRVNVHVRRFAVNNLPKDDFDLSQWLLKTFEEKDDLLSSYYEWLNRGQAPKFTSLE